MPLHFYSSGIPVLLHFSQTYPVHLDDDTRHGAVVAKRWILDSGARSEHALLEGACPLGVVRGREGVLDEVLPFGAVIGVTLQLLGVIVG